MLIGEISQVILSHPLTLFPMSGDPLLNGKSLDNSTLNLVAMIVPLSTATSGTPVTPVLCWMCWMGRTRERFAQRTQRVSWELSIVLRNVPGITICHTPTVSRNPCKLSNENWTKHDKKSSASITAGLLWPLLRCKGPLRPKIWRSMIVLKLEASLNLKVGRFWATMFCCISILEGTKYGNVTLKQLLSQAAHSGL